MSHITINFLLPLAENIDTNKQRMVKKECQNSLKNAKGRKIERKMK